MLHRQKINIQKPIHAVRQTPFLALLQLRALDVASHALFPANLRQVVRLYTFVSLATIPNSQFSLW